MPQCKLYLPLHHKECQVNLAILDDLRAYIRNMLLLEGGRLWRFGILLSDNHDCAIRDGDDFIYSDYEIIGRKTVCSQRILTTVLSCIRPYRAMVHPHRTMVLPSGTGADRDRTAVSLITCETIINVQWLEMEWYCVEYTCQLFTLLWSAVSLCRSFH
jgi:hypothetical protein